MKHLRAFGRPVSLALMLSMLAAAAPAFAQTDEQRAAARALATEGATAFNEGRYKDAADLFGRAESLVHAPPHLLFLARSYAKLGQFVRARETYIKITKEQVAASSPQAFRDAQTSAQDELRSVEPKIAKLTIQVVGGQDAQNLSVTVDGNVVPPVLIGVPQPVDPGEHRVEAVAAGKRARPQMVALRDGERGAVNLTLEPDASAVAPATPATATPPATGTTPAPVGTEPAPLAQPGPAAPPPAQSSGGGTNGMRIGSYVAFGVGAVGLGVGIAFLAKAGGKRSDADAAFKACSAEYAPDKCPKNSVGGKKTADLDDQATSASKVGVAGIVVGGIGVAAGVTLLVLSSSGSSSGETKTGRSLVPVVSPNYLGLAGTF